MSAKEEYPTEGAWLIEWVFHSKYVVMKYDFFEGRCNTTRWDSYSTEEEAESGRREANRKEKKERWRALTCQTRKDLIRRILRAEHEADEVPGLYRLREDVDRGHYLELRRAVRGRKGGLFQKSKNPRFSLTVHQVHNHLDTAGYLPDNENEVHELIESAISDGSVEYMGRTSSGEELYKDAPSPAAGLCPVPTGPAAAPQAYTGPPVAAPPAAPQEGVSDVDARPVRSRAKRREAPPGYVDRRFKLEEFQPALPRLKPLSQKRARELIATGEVVGVMRAREGKGYWLTPETERAIRP